MKTRLIGAHVSIQGGVFNAPQRARQLGANAMAMFVKNQRRWRDRAFDYEVVQSFKEQLHLAGIASQNVLVHSGYLINLGSPDITVRTNSVAALVDEIQRCEQLGLSRLVLHPGSHLRQISERNCLQLIAEGVNAALDETANVMILLENTAGQGSNLGYNFEQLASIIGQVGQAERIGVCIDTCHLWAAGYDLSQEDSYQATWLSFERLIGWSFLYGIHINDSKGGCGSHLDRHAGLGMGAMGSKVLLRLLADERLAVVPWVLETPNYELWSKEISWLRANG